MNNDISSYELSEEEIDNIFWIDDEVGDSIQDKIDYINSLLKERFQKGKEEERKRVGKEMMTIPQNYNCSHCNSYRIFAYNLTK